MNIVLTTINNGLTSERRFETETEASSFKNFLKAAMPQAQFTITSRPATWHNDKKARRGYKKEE